MPPSDSPAPPLPRPEPWDEDDRKIAERPAEGEWLGTNEPERFGEQIREHLERARRFLFDRPLAAEAFAELLRREYE